MIRLALTLTVGLALLTGCVSETVKSTQVPALDAPETLTPEAESASGVRVSGASRACLLYTSDAADE